MNQNLIIFALSFSDKPLQVSEIRKWIKEEAPKEYFGEIKVPVRETIHRNLDKLIDKGRVRRVIGNRYEPVMTMGSILAERLAYHTGNMVWSMDAISLIISWSKTHPEDEFEKWKDEPIFQKAHKQAMIAMFKLQNQIKLLLSTPL